MTLLSSFFPTGATYLAKPQIILAAQNSICYFPSNFPDITIPSDYQRNCILANRSHVVALDVDVRSKTMFFSDFVHKTIQSVRLSDGAVVKPVVGGVGSVEGMAKKNPIRSLVSHPIPV